MRRMSSPGASRFNEAADLSPRIAAYSEANEGRTDTLQ